MKSEVLLILAFADGILLGAIITFHWLWKRYVDRLLEKTTAATFELIQKDFVLIPRVLIATAMAAAKAASEDKAGQPLHKDSTTMTH